VLDKYRVKARHQCGFKDLHLRIARHLRQKEFRELHHNNVSTVCLSGFREVNLNSGKHQRLNVFREVLHKIARLPHKAGRILKDKKMEGVARTGPLELTKAKKMI
jgi:hypothetical protein